MQHDVSLRAAARAIYDACFPTEELHPSASTKLSDTGPSTTAERSKPPKVHARLDGRSNAQPSLF